MTSDVHFYSQTIYRFKCGFNYHTTFSPFIITSIISCGIRFFTTLFIFFLLLFSLCIFAFKYLHSLVLWLLDLCQVHHFVLSKKFFFLFNYYISFKYFFLSISIAKFSSKLVKIFSVFYFLMFKFLFFYNNLIPT